MLICTVCANQQETTDFGQCAECDYKNLVQMEALKARDLLELFDVFDLKTPLERIKIFKRPNKFISVSKRTIGKNKMVITTLMEIDLLNWIATNKDKIIYSKEDFKPCYAM